MLKKMIVVSSAILSLNAYSMEFENDGPKYTKYDQCAYTISCPAGENVKCTMNNGSAWLFIQQSIVNLNVPTSFSIEQVYATMPFDNGIVDCYYFPSDGSRYVLFRSNTRYNIQPDKNYLYEWEDHLDGKICDQRVNNCYLHNYNAATPTSLTDSEL